MARSGDILKHPRVAAAIGLVRGNRRDLVRIGVQTAAATVATYLVTGWLGSDHVSWAVIAALFTIGVSADASYYNARGRIVGALLGIALGLGAGWAATGSTLVGLVAAVVIANMVATLWPSVRYAAATAAIVALEPTPSPDAAMSVAGAILAGTLIAAATSFVLWPTFARNRVVHMLDRTLSDCRDLLSLADAGGAEVRRRRDALHAAFLDHLQSCRARISGTAFGPRLPGGGSLRDAATAVEALWHSIVILDRAIADECAGDSGEVFDALAPAIREVERRSQAKLRVIAEALRTGTATTEPPSVEDVVARARRQVRRRLAGRGAGADEAHGLYAVLFALGEIESRLEQLFDVVRAPESSGAGPARGR